MVRMTGIHSEVTDDYETFLVECGEATLYHTSKWLRLAAHLTNADQFWIADPDADGSWLACAPVALRDGPLGVIANSSPFFGSHGGILSRDRASFARVADRMLEFMRDHKVQVANIVAPLFSNEDAEYRDLFPIAATDMRIGQYKEISDLTDQGALLGTLGGMARSNLKRRAWRSGLSVEIESSAKALDRLHSLHKAQMDAKDGGNAKPAEFFRLLGSTFEPDTEYRVYWAKLDGKVIAGLLLLYWAKTVEYITPVFDPTAGDKQPLSALIFQAMLDAAREGFEIWNFGGSWPTQNLLRSFKSNWGVKERVYHYYIVDLGGLKRIMSMDCSILRSHYYGFYAYPFT